MQRACVALLLVLCGRCGAQVAPLEVVAVGNSDQFIAALESIQASQSAAAVAIELEADIWLSESTAEGYDLPCQLPSGRTLWLQSAGEGPRVLDFGGVHLLLNVQAGSTLVLANLNISGLVRGAAPPEGAGTVIDGLPIWPAVTADPAASFFFLGCSIQLYPSLACSPQTMASQVVQLQALGGSSSVTGGSQELSALFTNFSLPLPVLDARDASQVGFIAFNASDTTMTCTLPTPASSPPPDSSAGSEGGIDGGGDTPGWVWAVVGVGVAASVAAVAAGAVVWRRRTSRLSAQARDQEGSGVQPVPGEAGTEERKLEGLCGSGSGASGRLSVETLEPGAGGGAGLHGSVWRSRVGPIDDLHLGGVLGRGAFGHVYKGRWKGTAVAVKVVATHVGHGQKIDLSHEPLLSMALSHPNVLASYKMCVVRLITEGDPGRPPGSPPAPGGGTGGTTHPSASEPGTSASASSVLGSRSGTEGGNSGADAAGRLQAAGGAGPGGTGLGSPQRSSGTAGRQVVPSLTDPKLHVEVMPAQAVLEAGMYETWLVSELADRGSLAAAISAGAFKQADPPGFDVSSVLLCLLDVARGLDYLHSTGILHGDLKPQNVLLKTQRADRRGYVCKLADFGLSRLLGDQQTHIDTGTYGTAAFAAPELLSDGRLTRACDVYALGMLMWSMVAGQGPYPGMPAMQIICLVTQQAYRPAIPAHCPPRLADLVQRCWQLAPQARPNASSIVQELLEIGASLKPVPAPKPADPAP